jgi:hypothetical protein
MASVTVDVDIDEFDDAEVVAEAKRRGYRVIVTPEQMKGFHKWIREEIEQLDVEEGRPSDDDLSELLDCLRSQRYTDAIALVEALRFPKFKTLTECKEKYKKQKAA